MIERLLSRIDIKTTNDKLLLALSFLLFLPLLLDFVNAVTNGESGVYSIIIYVVSELIIFLSFIKQIKLMNILLVLFVLFIYAINAFLFPSSKDYIFESNMFILYGYFIPISILFISRISDWSSFFRILSYFGVVSIFMAARVILYIISIPDIKSEGVFSYMEFSYALSPLLCAMFARFLESNKFLYLIAFLIGIIEMFAYSSRAALLYTILFVIIAGFYYRKKVKKWFLVFILIICGAFFTSTSIQNKMENSVYFEASYVLRRFLAGEGTESSSREYIYKLCRQRINDVGFEVNGLFGDRPYCGDVYPHNIFYEVYMQMGYFWGTFVLLLLFILIWGAFLKSSNKLIVLFFLLTVLAKFLVSDSYLISGKFWILIGVLLSLSQKQSRKYENSFNKCNLSRA